MYPCFVAEDVAESILEFTEKLPKEKNACLGDKIELKVVVNASPEPTISWLLEEKDIEESERYHAEFDGETAVLVIAEATEEDDAMFTCIVENMNGCIECSCDLLVSEPGSGPKFIEMPRPVSVRLEADAEFQVQVEGTPKPDVKWILNDKVVKNRGRFQLIEEKDGKYVLIVEKCKATDSGIVKCTASNTAGEETCSTEIIVVEENSAPVLKEVTDNVCEFLAGSDARLELLISGNAELTVDWLKGFKRLLDNKDKYAMETTGNKNALIIKNLKLEDAGTYKCLASNPNGQQTMVFTVKVKGRNNLCGCVL